jgi:hypothetical protein
MKKDNARKNITKEKCEEGGCKVSKSKEGSHYTDIEFLQKICS